MKKNTVYAMILTGMIVLSGSAIVTPVFGEETAAAQASISYNVNMEVVFLKDTYGKSSNEIHAALDTKISKYQTGTLLGNASEGLAKVKIEDQIIYVDSSSFTYDDAHMALLKEKKAEEEAKKKEEEAKRKAEEEARKAAEEAEAAMRQAASNWSGPVLTASAGVNYGPSGKETYYNLPMQGVINIMRSMGNTDAYWVREDGAKMLGNYVMVAADLSIRPRGSLVPTSLGMGIVCDTGGFAAGNPTQLDIATAW